MTRVTTLKLQVKTPCRSPLPGVHLMSTLKKYRSKACMQSFSLRILTISMIVIFAGLFSSNFKSQTRSNTAENLDYVLVLPTAQWRAINVPGVVNDSTEFRYDSNGAIHLRIRRELVDADVTVADLIQRQ